MKVRERERGEGVRAVVAAQRRQPDTIAPASSPLAANCHSFRQNVIFMLSSPLQSHNILKAIRHSQAGLPRGRATTPSRARRGQYLFAGGA